MRSAVQVWTPYFWRSPFQEDHVRDLSRAQREWLGEDRVYLNPRVKEVTRWKRIEQGVAIRECVVPSETTNRFVVSHVDSEGRVYPYIPLPAFWRGSVSGLYARWVKENARLYVLHSDQTAMPMPVIKDGVVSMVKRPIMLEPGPLTTQLDLKSDGWVMEMTWGKPGNAEMLSPNQELKKAQDSTRYERQIVDGNEMLVVVSQKDTSVKGIALDLVYEKPFSYLLGDGGGAELVSHQAALNKCIDQVRQGDSIAAVREAERWISAFTGPGRSTIWHSWFAPMAQASVEEALFAVEGRYGIAASSIEHLVELEEYESLMQQSVDVLVIKDWVGYMWWDFCQDLREQVAINRCADCGGILRGGHKDRQFCTLKENPKCFRERGARRQRKSRS